MQLLQFGIESRSLKLSNCLKSASVPISSRDILGMSNQELVTRMEMRLESYELLAEVCDQDFIRYLVERKQDTENYLIWVLASDHPAATALSGQIDSALGILREENSLDCFRTKLRENYTS